MDAKLQKILKLALHQDTSSEEALAAFDAARRMIKSHGNSFSSGIENFDQYHYEATITHIQVRFNKVFYNTIMDFAFKNNILINIQMTDEGLKDWEKKSILVSSFKIKAKGPKKEIDVLKGILEELIKWINEQKS